MPQCPQCAKNFKSRSGLRRHIKGQHPTDEAPSHEEMATENQDADDLMTERDVILTDDQDAGDDEKVLKAALKALGIKRENVVQYKVYPHKVAIIEAPKNWKKTWYRDTS